MPFFKIRTSKFRHVYGSVARKDKCYENIKITKNAHDSNFCSVNPKFIAVVTETAGGGSFLVLPLNKTGRIEVNMPKVTGHRGNVLDIKWNPFDDNVIASCSDDTTVMIFQILLNDKSLAIIWNVETGEAVTYIQCHTDTIYNLSFNRDGSLLATTCKDKKLRLIDPRTGELLSETPGHQGTKSSKVTFLGDTDRLATCGFSRMCERQFGVWNVRDLSKPLRMENIDSGSGTLLPYYDQDTKVVFIAGKGDGNIRYYEIVPEAPYFHYLSEYKSSSPQRGLGVMPKRGLDVSRCEIMRFYKLHSVAGIVEPVAMIVPRKVSTIRLLREYLKVCKVLYNWSID
uniref:Coronin n=1 Tax=Saccoglossus kowalevskii TaxID=10224 RepID=A0ABM0MTE8_SACKO|nr:PREDICTED: coronin-2B-like [Saccoglossus kowalevskii]